MTERQRVVEQVEQRVRQRAVPKPPPKTRKEGFFLPTGSTMLNLAMTDRIDGGWPMGKINTLPGKSTAGKTVLVLSTFAEACLDPRFDNYLLIYDDVERRCDFNLDKLFSPLTSRLITPSGLLYADLRGNEDKSGISNTIEDMEITLTTLAKKGQPFIYVADSLDSFSTDEEVAKELLKAVAAAKSKDAADKVAQAHAARKAGIIHRILRNVNGLIANTKSLLIITQQLKQKIDAKPFERKWTTNGGEGPYFYSQVRPFMTRVGIRKECGCEVGTDTEVIMDKNSTTGKLRNIRFSIYNELGIDDIGSMVDFLREQKVWEIKGSWVDAPEFDLREQGWANLTRAVENSGKIDKLKRLVQRAWDNREDDIKRALDRKPRY